MLTFILILFVLFCFLLIRPLNNFQRGDLCPIKFQPVTPGSGAGGKVVKQINVTGHTLDRSVLLFDCTHTGLQGAGTGRIAGKSDSAGTVNLDVDADDPPYLTGNNIAGSQGTNFQEAQSGIMLFFHSATQASQIPVILEKCHYEVAVGSQNKASFDVKENVFAGVKVYPSA